MGRLHNFRYFALSPGWLFICGQITFQLTSTTTFRPKGQMWISRPRVAVALAFACAASAQPPDSSLAFEVASIRNNPAGGGRIKFQASPGGRLTVENMWLRLLMMNAWGVRDFQIAGGPGWIDTERFDVTATAKGNPSDKQVTGPMLQGLLEDRFSLKVHREVRELPVFTLSVARNGVNLRESKPGDCAEPGSDTQPQTPAPPCGAIVLSMSPEGARIRGEKAGMEQLVFTLSNMLGRTVIDRTGFSGKFEIDLAVATDDLPVPLRLGGVDFQVPADPLASSIFTALPKQLGLKLEAGKGPVEVIVIDHVERPTGN